MRIIINVPSGPETNLSASGNFFLGLIAAMAEKRTHHSFIYLINDNQQELHNPQDNVSYHRVNSSYVKWLGKKIWNKYLLTNTLRSLQADLYVSADNMFLGRTGTRSALFLFHHTETLQDSSSPSKQVSVSKLKRKAIQQADIVITFSDADRQWIEQFSFKKNQYVRLLMPRVAEIPELDWTEKELVKNEFSGGVEYFLFAGDLHERYDLISLLKAFSVFKKWQHSNMSLVIAGNKTAWTETFSRQLATFKFRKDVYLMVNLPDADLHRIIAGAYAMVYPAINDNFPVNILLAMQAGVPVISSSFPVAKEWCGDTVMFPETNDSAGLGKSMQLIYKDEQLRSAFIDAARLRLSAQTKTDMAEACLNFFEETMAK